VDLLVDSLSGSRAVGTCLMPDTQRFELLCTAARKAKRRLRAPIELARVTSWPALSHRLDRGLGEFIVVDAFDPRYPALRPIERRVRFRRSIAGLRRAHPISPVLVCAHPGGLAAFDIIVLHRLGVVGFLDLEDGPEWVAERLRMIPGLSVACAAIDSLAGIVPERWCALLMRALPYAHRGDVEGGEPALSASGLASLWLAGATADSLASALSRDTMPPPGWIVRWLICLRIATLKPRVVNLSTLAFAMGFPSEDSMRRYVRRFAGVPPTGLVLEDLTSRLRSVVSGASGAAKGSGARSRSDSASG
jgi:hypothetical protein